MEVDKERKKIGTFIKTGIMILTLALIVAVGVKAIPEVISVTGIIKSKKLPIYCVNTEEKKVALSFDAAWGDGYL